MSCTVTRSMPNRPSDTMGIQLSMSTVPRNRSVMNEGYLNLMACMGGSMGSSGVDVVGIADAMNTHRIAK